MSFEGSFSDGQRPLLALRVDDDSVPLTGNLTIGRHLDNDLIIAGEDVLDYHARVSLTARAVMLHPLLDATIVVNDRTYDHAIGIVPGDQVRIGASEVSVRVDSDRADSEAAWQLHHTTTAEAIALHSAQTVGREEDADIRIDDDHISRAHARISLDRYVWLSDLGSANGTFVNDARIMGGVRLFHGDYVSFDAVRYQLVGSGADLTPVRLSEEVALTPIATLDTPEIRSDTTIVGSLDMDADVRSPALAGQLQLPHDAGTGAFLIGASEPVTGEIFRTKIGRCVIGRGPNSDIVINDQTVSLQHAEVVARAEGCTLTNLMATNGTRVNGEPIQSQQLADGDIIRLGQVTLVYKDVPVAAAERRLLRRLGLALLGACVLSAAGLLLLD